MKKFVAMMLAVLMALSLAACGQPSKAENTENTAGDADTTQAAPAQDDTTAAPEETTAPETTAPETTAAPVTEEGFSFVLEGVTLVPGTAFDSAALPEAQSTYQVPSCAIEGTDNVYNYGTVEVTAFNDGSGEVIYSVYIVDANTPTDEGLYIGDTLDQAAAIYGEDYVQESSQITYQKGDTLLVMVLDGDYFACIDFRWAN